MTITSVGAGYTSAPTVSITGGGGSGAAATAVVTGGQVTGINIANPGTGYTSAPTISLNSGSGAAATASLGLSNVVLTSNGSGYKTAPTVIISGGGGSGATATATISGGRVSRITIVKTGSGYTSPPTITFSGGDYTTPATATAVCNVVALTITSPGSGYTSPPTVVFGTPSAGGFSNEVDFGNLNQKTTMQFDVNGFLGSAPGSIADTSADSFNGQSNFVNISVTIAAHELGHTLGLQHFAALGPIGFGIANPPGSTGYLPAYTGLTGAFTTQGDVIASPASVGSSLANAASGLAQLGARDAITLAFITGGTTVASNATDPTNPSWSGMPSPTVPAQPNVPGPVALAGLGTVDAQPVSLYSLNVPNTITRGFGATKKFDVSAVNIDGYLGGSANVLDSGGQPIINPATGKPYTVATPNFYTFQGVAGQKMSFQVMSSSITSIKNPVDTTLTIFGPDGQQIAFNDDQFEPSDSSIFDLLLPSTGTYTVEVDSFHTNDPAFLDSNSQNYNPAAYYHAQHGAYELFMYTFSAFNSLQPPSVTNGSTATLVLPPSSGGSDQTIYLNSNTVATVPSGSSWYTVRNLSNGSNTIEVKDASGNTLSSYVVTVDTTAPTVAINSGPAAQTTATTAAFTFSGSDSFTPSSRLIYLASLDGGRFSAVTNPATFTNLGVGSHTLEVEAQDEAGNTSSPVSITWTINPTVATTTALTSSAVSNTSVYGQPVTLVATVGHITVNPNSPTGKVAFHNGTTKLGSADLTNGQFQAAIPVNLPAGTYTITATYEGDGTDLTSSSFTYSLIVTPAPLTISVNNLSKVYGQRNPDFTASYQGFVNGESSSIIWGTPRFTTTATSKSSVGDYDVALDGLTSPNYAIRFVGGRLSVTPAPLTVSAVNAVKLYGLAVPNLSAVYSGFVNGDTAASLTTQAKLTTPATALSPVGNYTITPGGASSSNYAIQYVPGTLKVESNAGPAAFVNTLYRLALGRRPEPAALTSWLTHLANGESQSSVAQKIYNSQEARLARARHKVPQLKLTTVYARALRAEMKAFVPA
ncbi:MAG: MBG domain-containing protein [Isosphaeraceae bacterium]